MTATRGQSRVWQEQCHIRLTRPQRDCNAEEAAGNMLVQQPVIVVRELVDWKRAVSIAGDSTSKEHYWAIG